MTPGHQRSVEAGSLRVRVSCTAPYDWHGVLAFFRVRAVPGIEICDADSYARSVVIDKQPGVITVRPGADGGNLEAVIQAPVIADRAVILKRLEGMFDTAADMQHIDAALDADAGLLQARREPCGMRVAGAWDQFELTIRAILGQQVTVAAGRTLSQRLCESFGGHLPVNASASPGMVRLFPSPAALADADIQRIGMPARRAQTVRAVARAVANGDIITDGDPDALEAGLLSISGIGPWTAGYVRMRACKDPDAFPAADIALLNAARRLGIADSHKTLLAAAERWRPWRAYAAVRLWQSL